MNANTVKNLVTLAYSCATAGCVILMGFLGSNVGDPFKSKSTRIVSAAAMVPTFLEGLALADKLANYVIDD